MKILIIEDEHLIANSLKKGLEQEHYTVDLAFNGLQGFDLASTEKYDLILLDLMLPKMDGMTVCKKLREEENNHTPILMLTAKSQLEDKINGLNCGADDYLSKPFAFEELLARVRALSRRPQKTNNKILKFADISLNTSTYQVKRGNQVVELSNREYSLLECFLRHSGQILTKDQLIQHVWSYESDILPNTVEVNIRNLRQKLDLPFKNKKASIKTIRGFGYKLDQ